jgi:hypothetical protein
LRNWVFGEPHPPTQEELAEIKIQQVIMVRNSLANVFEDDSGFYQWMKKIDHDESGTVSAKEFLGLLMMIQYNPLAASNDKHANDLTIELSTNCWNTVLAQESEGLKFYSKNTKEREIRFRSLKSWIFQRKLSPTALKSWALEDDAVKAKAVKTKETETLTKTLTQFKSAKDVFVYLNTIDHIVVEQLKEGQYLVTNRENNHPFLLLEERSDFWCNMLCYPAHPMFFKVRKLFCVFLLIILVKNRLVDSLSQIILLQTNSFLIRLDHLKYQQRKPNVVPVLVVELKQPKNQYIFNHVTIMR